jgi:hypothetical protein
MQSDAIPNKDEQNGSPLLGWQKRWNDTGAATDAGSSASALLDWTYFDMEKSPDAVKSLVNRYLARDYSNPLVESEIEGVRFDFLKCMDLYHSKALRRSRQVTTGWLRAPSY